jgi:hypothetical protein
VLVTLAVLLTIYYVGDQRKGNKMGRARATNGGEEKCIQGFGGVSGKDKGYLEDINIKGG